MKIKRSDRSDWQRVKKGRYALLPVEHEFLNGHASLFCIDEIKEPLWVPYAGRLICVADQGHHWMQLFPQGANHVVTVMYDQDGGVTQWYIDICKPPFMDDKGEMWYEDLYLDIIFIPGDKIELIDVEELDEALQRGMVSGEEYNLAWNEASKLLTSLEEGTFQPLQVAVYCRELLLGHMA